MLNPFNPDFDSLFKPPATSAHIESWFYREQITPEEIEGMVNELERLGLVKR